MAMYEGYFDESGSFDEDPKVFCISGYFVSSEQARVMDDEWGRVLRDHDISYFHMVDCAHGTGIFAGIPRDKRIEIVRSLIELIKNHTVAGFSVLAREDVFEASAKHPDPYSVAVRASVATLQTFMQINRIGGDIRFVFEHGHKNRGRAYSHVAEQLTSSASALEFARKEDVRLLQAADLLAWQSTKYTKDRLGGTRPPRKDFLSLMEHHHSLAYLSIKRDRGSVGFEEWPVSRRSPTSASLTFDHSGPVTVVFQDGDKTPIIPVTNPLGYRMGVGRMANVKFEDVGKKSFYLAFDELRLHEAIIALVQAKKIYADDGNVPLIAASDVLIEDDEFLRVTLSSGSSLDFRLSKEAIQRLKAQLKIQN